MTTQATPGKGCFFYRGNGASPEVFTKLAEVTSINPSGATLDTIDVTNMDSGGYKEFIQGLKDGGDVSVGMNFLPGAATHLRMMQDFKDPAVRNYRVEWSDAYIAATLATGSAGANNGVTWTAVRAGSFGNDIQVVLVNPGATGSLAVSVSGKTITVTLAYASGAITTTGAQLIAAIVASSDASELVSVAATGASSGAGLVAAVSVTNLAGGRGHRFTFPGLVAKDISPTANINGALVATGQFKVAGEPTIEGVS